MPGAAPSCPRSTSIPLAFGVPPHQIEATDTSAAAGLDGGAARCSTMSPTATRTAGPRAGQRRARRTGATAAARRMGARLGRPVWLHGMRRGTASTRHRRRAADLRSSDQFTPWQEATFPGLLSNVVAGRIANRLDLHGTNCTTRRGLRQFALGALSIAVGELALGRLRPGHHRRRRHLQRHPDVHVLQQDAGAVPHRGLPALLCRGRRDHARRGDGDVRAQAARGRRSATATAIYAVHPRHRLLLRRPGHGHLRTRLRRAGARPAAGVRAAGYGPDTVELVEAHGTGTPAGDAAEFGGLSAGVRRDRPARTWDGARSGRSSRRSGTPSAAAGAAGMLKAVLALHHRSCRPRSRWTGPTPHSG